MLKPWKKTTYQDVIQHAEGVIAEIQANPAFVEVSERAQALGVTLEFGYRHTLDEEHRGSAISCAEPDRILPHGYTMELWLDLCDAKNVLVSKGEEESRTQYSISATVCEYVEGLFTHKIDFLDAEKVIKNGFPLVMLEEFLDAIEENGAMPGPFMRDSLVPEEPVGESLPVYDMGQLVGGSYVVLVSGAYEGTTEGKASIFISEHAFLPYKYLLLGVVSLERLTEGEQLVLTKGEAERFLELLDEIKYVENEGSYTDTLNNNCGVTAYAPPPNTERLLDKLTLYNFYDFVTSTDELIGWIGVELSNADTLTIVW